MKPATVQDHGFDRVRRLCRQQADRARQELTLGFFLKVTGPFWLELQPCASCYQDRDQIAQGRVSDTALRLAQVLLLILLRKLRPRAAKRLELLCLSIPLPAALAKLQVLPLPRGSFKLSMPGSRATWIVGRVQDGA